MIIRVEAVHFVLEKLFVMLCEKVIGNFDYYEPALCEPLTAFFGHNVLNDVFARHLLRSDIFCSKYLGMCDVPTFIPLPVDDYVERVLETKPLAL